MNIDKLDLSPIRSALAQFEISPSVAPNETINIDRVYFPRGHRGVLDSKRQLVVGNRGMGKSFWTHALTNTEVRERVADAYAYPALITTKVVIGFNASVKLHSGTPTIEDIQEAHREFHNPELIWRAVILRAIRSFSHPSRPSSLAEDVRGLRDNPRAYAEELTAADDSNTMYGSSILVLFDALDRLSSDWATIRDLTKGLLVTVLGLQSFRSIRAKVFMRVDQFSDLELFRFQDSSKLRNDHVDLAWDPHELYGLLLFELQRDPSAVSTLEELASIRGAQSAIPTGGKPSFDVHSQQTIITSIAGEFMGSNRKRGRVYTWVPLHLSDAANNCSPRTFLTAWKTAAEHLPAPVSQAVDHLGLSEGVRQASKARMTELREDFLWIDLALEPLRHHFVPLERNHLFGLWQQADVIRQILDRSRQEQFLAPVGIDLDNTPDTLLKTMTSVAAMEERANGKINVPDIFRVEAGILRKGGVAVPRKN
jgi:hypothetical protein